MCTDTPTELNVLEAIKAQINNTECIPHACIISVRAYKKYTGRRLPRKIKKRFRMVFVRTNGRAYTNFSL